MNGVIYFNPGHINGCLFDAFEYYVSIAKYSISKFFIISEYDYLHNLEHAIYFNDIIDIYKDKYNVDEYIYHNIIYVKNRKHMLSYSLENKLNKVLIVDQFTPHIILSYLYAKEYYILVEVYSEVEADYIYLNKDSNKKLFSEYLLYKEQFSYD